MKELFFNTLWICGIIVVIMFALNIITDFISSISIKRQKKQVLKRIEENSNELVKIFEQSAKEIKEEETKKNKSKENKQNKSK